MEDTCIGCQYLKHPCCTHISSFLRLFGSYSWTIFEASVLHVLQFFLLKAIWLVVQYLHNIWTIFEQYLNFIWTIVEQYLNNISSSYFARLTFLPSIWLVVICLAFLPIFSLLSPWFTSLIWINHSNLKDFVKSGQPKFGKCLEIGKSVIVLQFLLFSCQFAILVYHIM